MTPTERDLRAFLDGESEHVDVVGSFAAAVVATKRRSDRRRVVAGAVTAIVAVVVAVPLLWSKPAGRQIHVPATTPVTVTPTPRPSTTTPQPAVTTTVSIKDAAAVGDPRLSASAPFVDPGVPYAVRGTFHDGAAAPVDGPLRGGFPTFERLDHGGFIMQGKYGTNQGDFIVFTDRTGTVLKAAAGFVVSADRSRIAWSDGSAINAPGEGTIHLADSRGKELSIIKVDAAPTALVGRMLYAVKVGGYDYLGESLRIDLDTGRQTVIKGNVMDVDADRGLALAVGGLHGEPGAPVCYSVLDVRGDRPVTRLSSCGNVVPEAFSPDGRFLIAGSGAQVVDVNTGQVVLDAIGTSRLNPVAGRMTDDGSALVVSVSSADYSRSGLIRCTLDGACAQVGGPSIAEPPDSDTDSPRGAYAVSGN
ncbi:hypothetical protein GCM10027053_36380 [Intrasporangium mesophilum]